MIFTNTQWENIRTRLVEDFEFNVKEDSPDKIVFEKDCLIGGYLTITYYPTDGNTGDEIFQFAKRMAGEKKAKFSRIVPYSIQQFYGAVRIMEVLV